VIVAVPTATPVTTPVLETMATAVFELDHQTARPVNTIPPLSTSFALAETVWLTWISEITATVTATTPGGGGGVVGVDGGGGDVGGDVGGDGPDGVDGGGADGADGGAVVGQATKTPTFAEIPSHVAVIVAVPTETPVTEPVDETVATALLLLLQSTVRPVRTLPAESFSTTDACALSPGAMVEALMGTVMLATGAGGGGSGAPTMMGADATFPSLAAVIIAVPTPTPVTTPVGETTATLVSLVLHRVVRSVNAFPAESLRVADACAVVPSTIVDADSATLTLVIVGGGGGGGATTVRRAPPDFPCTDATIVVVPAARATTTPVVGDIVATPESELLQRTVSLFTPRLFPAESLSVEVAWVVCPTNIVGAPSATLMLANAATPRGSVASPEHAARATSAKTVLRSGVRIGQSPTRGRELAKHQQGFGATLSLERASVKHRRPQRPTLEIVARP
jgi:hypothetical protein